MKKIMIVGHSKSRKPALPSNHAEVYYPTMKKILILGHARSGKTTFANLLSERLGVKCIDSSAYCFEKAVWPTLKDKYGYKTKEEAIQDRVNRREDWFNLISEYNDVPDRVSREILSESDIYVGMRNRREFEGSKHLFDLILWVDASKRVPNESTKSMELTQEDAHQIVYNNHDLGTLKIYVEDIAKEILLSL